MIYRLFLFCSAFLQLHVMAQTAENMPRNYQVVKTAAPPAIDGKIGKREWKRARWTEDFVDISTAEKPLQRTRVKMLWDDQYLYVAALLYETDLWATLKNHDDIIFKDNDFEVFIDPNDDASNYFEIEINAFGTVMDLFMHKTYKRGGPMEMKWDTQGMLAAVNCKGTLNNPSDKDRYWSVEMAIPYSCLKRPERKYLPQLGDKWRINFSRVEWQLLSKEDGYVKKTKTDGSRIPEFNWVWSPQGEINMHIPERWGYLTFSGSKKKKLKL